MKQIRITRSYGVVTFETVSIDTSENVFFTNMDTEQPHWPELSTNQLGPAPSPNSSQCTVPQPKSPLLPPFPYVCRYRCKISGHENEVGVINVFNPLAAGTTTLPSARVGTPIASPVQVVTGGMSPYQISDQVFQVTDNNGKIQRGSGSIGPGLKLQPSSDSTGITVTGTPTVVGTYNFTFIVNDAKGANLQQVQYSMAVA